MCIRDRSRRCTWFRAADGRLVVEATMGSLAVVVVGPGGEAEVTLVGVEPVSSIGPLAEGGLDEAFGFAVGLRRVRTSAAVFEAHVLASVAELVRTITAAVVGKQSAHADAVASEKVNGILEEGDGGVGLLIGQD